MPAIETFPTKPSYAVAQNAYQTLVELTRAHPEDLELPGQLADAWRLLVDLWTERMTGSVPFQAI